MGRAKPLNGTGAYRQEDERYNDFRDKYWKKVIKLN